MYRNDVFIRNASGTVVQLTDKSLANYAQISGPHWSPDGSAIAFNGYVNSLNSVGTEALRIAVDGKTKAVNLTASVPGSVNPIDWRN